MTTELENSISDYNNGLVSGACMITQPVDAEVQYIEYYDDQGIMIGSPKNSFAKSKEDFMDDAIESASEYLENKCYDDGIEHNLDEVFTFVTIGYNKKTDLYYVISKEDKIISFEYEDLGSMYEQHNTLWMER